MPYPVEFLFLGFTVSFFVGLTGMGGGALMTPALIFLGISPRIAIGTDLLYAAITRFLGSALHFRKGNVDIRLALILLIGSIPATLLSGTVMKIIEDSYGYAVLDVYLMKILGITLVLVSLVTLYKALNNGHGVHTGSHPSTPVLLLVGFLSVALSSSHRWVAAFW